MGLFHLIGTRVPTIRGQINPLTLPSTREIDWILKAYKIVLSTNLSGDLNENT